MCTECIHTFRLFRRNLLHIIVWKTSRLKFSFAVELLLYLRTIPKVLTFYWIRATVIGLGSVAVPWLSDWTPLHSTRQVVGELAACRRNKSVIHYDKHDHHGSLLRFSDPRLPYRVMSASCAESQRVQQQSPP